MRGYNLKEIQLLEGFKWLELKYFIFMNEYEDARNFIFFYSLLRDMN